MDNGRWSSPIFGIISSESNSLWGYGQNADGRLLRYILFELLKNVSRRKERSRQSNKFQAFQATLLKHPKSDPENLPVVRATVVSSANELTIRISDQGQSFMRPVALLLTLDSGGGIAMVSVNSSDDLFSFSHTRNSSRLEDARLGALRSASARS